MSIAGWTARSGRTGRCGDRKSTRLNSSHLVISYAVFCLKKKKFREVPGGAIALRITAHADPAPAALALTPAQGLPRLCRLMPDSLRPPTPAPLSGAVAPG